MLETPDCDEIAMTLLILHRAGYPVDSRCLLAYECPEHFACFLHERNPSLSANLHVLAALALLPAADQPRVGANGTKALSGVTSGTLRSTTLPAGR